MADRYWVGGTANWDGTAGTKWATTSGGAGGAAVPTSADNVYFDANSGSGTVTITGATAVCRNLTCTGFTGTLAGSAFALECYGDFVLASGMTYTSTNPIFFYGVTGTFTVDLQGKTVGTVTLNGSATRSLASAFSSSGALNISIGTFTTNNYNVTATQLSSSNSNTRTINLGSSTVTLSATAPVVFTVTSGLVFNANTSTISLTATTGATFDGNGLTYYNVVFPAASASNSITGTNTFNNVTFTGPASAGVSIAQFGAGQVINGTLSTTGTAGNRRVWIRSSTYGIAQTLTINSAPSLTDADFRDIYVIGTAAPISGTRIGNLRGCSGITFDAPKTVYWVTAAGGNWSGNNWAATSGGAASTDNFPLAQDTAKIENTGLNTSATVTLDSAITYYSTVDMSTRTNAMSFSTPSNITFYGDIICGSGTSPTSSGTLTFSGRNTQTITSAGKTFANSFTIDSYGGTVQLADAFNIGAGTLTVTNGTFDTKNYNVTAGALSSSNSNVRTITLGSSTVTLSSSSFVSLNVNTNLTFNAGTSTVTSTYNSGGMSVLFGGNTFYNVSFTGTTATTYSIASTSTTVFNNLTVTAPASAGLIQVIFSGNINVNGTLTVAGATAVRRIFLRSDTLGTTRTLTVNTLSANDCDFRDITIAGTAAGSSPTRAGDCGGNSGITFPAPKTVYWNLGGAGQLAWSDTAWATSSGGSPAVNNFPLAQDTAVFDDTGAMPTGGQAVSVSSAFNVGTINASGRTSAGVLQFSAGPVVYGSFSFGTGITTTSVTGGVTFSGRGTQTITSNGVTFNNPVTVDCFTGTVQLADALTLSGNRTLALISGTFDAVSYNVTVGISSNGFINSRLKMGSGTWTLTGTGTVWDATGLNNTASAFYKGTANIVLTDTSTTARTFNGAGLSYNKLTIGGTTGTSTLTITSNNQFTEIASTKTVAHTIALGTTTQTFGKWSVTGTAGNVVTVTGTATITIAGAAVSGVDYIALGTTVLSTTSPGEFYAGANSTGTGTGITLTAAPTPRTLYWVGGTGNWSSTTKWSTSSGGASGAAIPTSLDDVVFDSLSNATAYTATIDPTQARCKSLTIAGPLVGNVTIAGTGGLATHGSVSLATTGITRTYTGAITLSSSSTGLTFTTNGNTLASDITINGVNCGWSLGSALNIGTSGVQVSNGSFDLATYNLTANTLLATGSNSRTLDLDTGTITLGASTPLDFGSTETSRATLTFTASTSQINCSNTNPTFTGNNQTFYNVSFTSTAAGTVTINGTNTFNNLSVTGITTAGLKNISVTANQTINGTLTFSAGTNATMRTFVRSDTIGTTRTLTCAAFSGTDVDFRDITIAGAAAPVSGTRLGDCKGNSGITFPAAKTVYWGVTSNANWGAAGTTWSATNGGATSHDNFPLAQDTAVFPSSPTAYPSSGGTVTLNTGYNIGTIDMSARTSNTMTLATGSTAPAIYGNWINGTGTTLSGTGTMTFAGRGSQTITSAGITFTQPFTINSPSGSVTLQDAFSNNFNGTEINLSWGTFDANGYNVTLSGVNAAFISNTSNTRSVNVGSGTWTNASTTIGWQVSTTTGFSVSGTGTISMTGASAKTFQGGGISYSGITLDQGGAGTLTISGNNTFKNITNSYSATGATTIAMGTTTQTVTQFTATGTSGKVLTVQGSSASSPATLILTSGSVTTPDYLTITGVRAYNLSSTWYAGANSTNNGSLGWIFAAAGGTVYASIINEAGTGVDSISSSAAFKGSISESGTGVDSISSSAAFKGSISESGTGTDRVSASAALKVTTLESAAAADSLAAKLNLYAALSEAATISDIVIGSRLFFGLVSETGSISDLAQAIAIYSSVLSEVATIADSVRSSAVFLGSVSESGTGSDMMYGGYNVYSAIAETASIQDLAYGAKTFYTSVLESGTAVDLLYALAAFSSVASDSAVVADVPYSLGVFLSSVSDTATGADQNNSALLIPRTVLESAIADSTVSTKVRFNTVVIGGQMVVSDRASTANNILSGRVREFPIISDSVSARGVFPRQIDEVATGADTTSGIPTLVARVLETAGAAEQIYSVAVMRSSVYEAAVASASFDPAGSVYNTRFLASASVLDSFNPAGSVYNPVVQIQTATASDVYNGAFLWNLIDDSQTGVWGVVPTTQSAGWGLIDDSQNPGWQNVDTL